MRDQANLKARTFLGSRSPSKMTDLLRMDVLDSGITPLHDSRFTVDWQLLARGRMITNDRLGAQGGHLV